MNEESESESTVYDFNDDIQSQSSLYRLYRYTNQQLFEDKSKKKNTNNKVNPIQEDPKEDKYNEIGNSEKKDSSIKQNINA